MLRRLIAVLLGALFVAAVAVYGLFGAELWRWGCPSTEELQRPCTPDEVAAAFEDAGLPLGRIGWPPEATRTRAYERATAFRHSAPRASLTVVVCRATCNVPQFRPRLRGARRIRFGIAIANVASWIQGADRSADAALREPLSRAVDGLDVSVDPDSRCYVG